QPPPQFRARATAESLCTRAGAIELGHERIQHGIETAIVSSTQRGQASNSPVEVCRQRWMAAARSLGVHVVAGGAGCRDRRGNPDRTAPFVENVKHVCLAEIDTHRPAPRALRVVELDGAIDAAERDLERHAALSPPADQLE